MNSPVRLLTARQVADLEEHAVRLRNHIAEIMVDFPEAADARRRELHYIYRKIAASRRAPHTEDR